MKFTTLFSAVALAAAMSTQAATTTNLAGDDFNSDSYTIPDGAESVAVSTLEDFADKWDGNFDSDGDSSEIVATHFENGEQALHLNTNGEQLSLRAASSGEDGSVVTVSMKVDLVASDTMVDMSTDTTSHTALFLYDADEEDEIPAALMAFAELTDGNAWVALTPKNETETLSFENSKVANVQIEIDYDEGLVTYTVNGVVCEPLHLANSTQDGSWATTKALSAVAFKGTGYVDDLFVSETVAESYKADFIYQVVVDDEDPEEGETFSDCDLTDDPIVNGFADVGETETLVGIKVFEVEDQAETEVISSVPTTDVDGDDSIVEWRITPDLYDGWKNGATYYVRAFYSTGSEPEPTVWTADTTIAAGSLVWTAYDAAAGEADFTWTAAAGYAPQLGDTLATLTVLTTTELGGETVTPYGIVWLGTDGTGHVDGLPKATADDASPALFLIGLDDAKEDASEE